MLKKCTELLTSNTYKLEPHGDNFFNLINRWINKLDLGPGFIKNEKIIKQNIIDLVVSNPDFSPLFDDYSFQNMVEKLEKLKEKHNENKN